MYHHPFGLVAFCLLNSLCNLVSSFEVIELTSGNFYPTLANNEFTLVMYSVPICVACSHFVPEFRKAGEQLEDASFDFVLATVDCSAAGQALCVEHRVTTYPRIDIYRHEVFLQEYTGLQNAEHITGFIVRNYGVDPKTLDTVDDLNFFLNSTRKTSVVGYFKDKTDMKKAFFRLYHLKGRFRFGYSDNSRLMKKENAKNQIVMYRPPIFQTQFEEQSLTYKGPPDPALITQFIESNYLGLVGHRVQSNKRDFSYPLIVVYYNVDFDHNLVSTLHVRNKVMKVAAKYKKRIYFAISNKDDFMDEIRNLNVFVKKEQDVPENPAIERALVVARDAHNKKYIMKTDSVLEGLDDFARKFLSNELDSQTKSLPIPKETSDNIKVAVAFNFDEIVVTNNKDTIINFHVPFSSQSLATNKVFRNVAKTLQREDNVVFVQMDAFANEIRRSFNVTVLPVIYWLPKNDKESPIMYDEVIDENELVKFIAKHATVELKGFDREGNRKV